MAAEMAVGLHVASRSRLPASRTCLLHIDDLDRAGGRNGQPSLVVSRLFARIFSSISETELPFAFKENPEK
jgi:hypothetical protein